MKAKTFSVLENDNKTKRKYISHTIWLRQFMIVPPIIIVFFGFFGSIYLLNNDLLYTYYSIPYILLLLLGTLWLKAVKANVIQKELAKKDAYLACLVQPVFTKGGLVYALFTTGAKRSDPNLLKRLAKSFSEDNLPTNAGVKKALALPLSDTEDEQVYIKAFSVYHLKRKTTWKGGNDLFIIFFIDKNQTPIISSGDILGIENK